MSVAQAFSRRVNTESSILEPLGSDTSWGPMVGTRSVHDTEQLEDMYIEEIMTTGEKA